MGDVIVATDSNFTQDKITLSSSGWTSLNSFVFNYGSWISGLGWHYNFATNAEKSDAYDVFATSTFYVKVES